MAKKKAKPVVDEIPLKFQYHEDFTAAPDGYIFVFGSNLSGFHGAGAAKAALDYYGAKIGPAGGEGLHGKSYAIPTKDEWIQTREMPDIIESIIRFVAFTKENPELKFWVTQVGCGLAGLKVEDVAPYFYEAENCSFAEEWKDVLEACELGEIEVSPEEVEAA